MNRRRSSHILLLVGTAALTALAASASRPRGAAERSGDAPGFAALARAGKRAGRATLEPVARRSAAAPVAEAGTGTSLVTSDDPGALPPLVGTYLAEMAANGAAALSRWDDQRASPVRVWLASGDTLAGWQPVFDGVVRQAFAAWEQVGLPLRFAFTDVPGDADVHVTWAERLPERRAGVAHWVTGPDGWLARGAIVLATWVSDGTRADDASVYRIALHEIGHLLGLGHSTDPADVMAPWVTAGDLTGRDLATARLMYSLTPGQIAHAGRPAAPAGATTTAAPQ